MAKKRKAAAEQTHTSAFIEEVQDIPLDEQVRLIKQSGILGDAVDDAQLEFEEPGDEEPVQATPESGLEDEIFNTILLLIPFSFLYLGMDIMIKQQYQQHPGVREEIGQMINAVPILALFIFYSNRYKNHILLQAGMTVGSMLCGCRLIYIINKESWLVVIRQCPPLGVLWVYTIVQLPLSYACFALLVVYGFVRYYSLKVIF